MATRQVLDLYRVKLERNGMDALKMEGLKAPSTSGNGSLMRLAPLPVFYHSRPADAVRYAVLQSQVTHASDMAVESCVLATVHILGFVHEPDGASTTEKKARVLASDFVPKGVGELVFKTEQVLDIRKGTWKEKSGDEIKTSGFVIDSLEAALWALWTTNTFEEVRILEKAYSAVLTRRRV
jgi:ADP-ribosyl-[dinitrogen reductase] hydrolase